MVALVALPERAYTHVGAATVVEGLEHVPVRPELDQLDRKPRARPRSRPGAEPARSGSTSGARGKACTYEHAIAVECIAFS